MLVAKKDRSGGGSGWAPPGLLRFGFAGGFLFGRNLALPVFVDNDFLFGVCCFVGHGWVTSDD